MKKSDAGPNLKLLTRAFRDPEDEAAYIRHHFDVSLKHVRGAIVSGFVVLLIFGYIDYQMFEDLYWELWLGRGVCALYIVLGFAFTYTRYFRVVMQPVLAFGATLCGGLAIWLIYMTQGEPFCSHLYAGIMVCMIFACLVLRLRFVWAAGSSLLMLVGFVVAAPWYLEFKAFLFATIYLALATLSSILGAYLIETYLRQTFWSRKQYQALLERILPAPIASRLNDGETIIADDKSVSVLFADIVGSVEITAQFDSAKQLVDMLNQIFGEFDRLVEDHGLETIKTIGDGFMVAGNCTRALADHTRAIADLALEMQAAIQSHRDADGRPLALRIGIHAGPVVAGVMNLRKLSYDLWGDTVNVASRMESSAESGAILITAEAADEIREDYDLEGPFEIPVKGKGLMSVYHLIGRLSDPHEGPPIVPTGGPPAAPAETRL